jgi:prepilin-type N-terminal cleavage/methylation domain-containing protein
MRRRGFTLIELMAHLSVLGLVLGMGHTLLLELMRAARPPAHALLLVDLACDQVRRDVRAGAVETDGVLVAGGHRWSRTGQRDGTAKPGIRALAWQQRAGVWVVTVTPHEGKSRTIEVTP